MYSHPELVHAWALWLRPVRSIEDHILKTTMEAGAMPRRARDRIQVRLIAAALLVMLVGALIVVLLLTGLALEVK